MPDFQYIEFLLLLIIVPLLVGLFLYTIAKKRLLQKNRGSGIG